MEVEDKVKLADIAEVVIQDLHKQMDGLQVCQLIVSHVHTEAEVQPRIPPVDDLVGLELQRQPTPLSNVQVLVIGNILLNELHWMVTRAHFLQDIIQ